MLDWPAVRGTMTNEEQHHSVMHTDLSRSESRDQTDDGVDKVASEFKQDESETAYSGTENRGRDVTLETPVQDVAELDQYAHLSVLIGESKRDHETYESTTDDEEPTDVGGEAFDMAVLDLAVPTLAAEGLTIETLPVEPAHVRALFLQRARSESLREFEAHLKNEPGVTAAVGYDDAHGVRSYSTLSRAASALERDGTLSGVENAAKRAVHAAERRGELIPYAARQAHGLVRPAEIDERYIAPHTQRTELIRWVEELLPALTDPITFDRQDPTYSVQQIIGTLAQAALINGIESGPPSTAWHYDASEIPSARHVRRLLRQHDRETIRQQFNEVREQLVEIASEYGFFADAYDYALDPTWVAYDGDKEAGDPETYLINNPEECDTGVGWCFTAVTAADREARFMFGVDLARSKDERTGQFRRILWETASHTNIGRLHIDREFYDKDAVQMCRAFTGVNWAIRAKRSENGEVREKFDATPVGESALYTDVEFSGLENTPNLFVYAVPSEYDDLVQADHIAFLTDLSDETAFLEGMFGRYLNRWSIEITFRQLKRELMPDTTSDNGEFRLFLFNIASIFYNIHTLINRAISPTFALRLDVPYYEVLHAIVDASFSRSPPTDQ